MNSGGRPLPKPKNKHVVNPISKFHLVHRHTKSRSVRMKRRNDDDSDDEGPSKKRSYQQQSCKSVKSDERAATKNTSVCKYSANDRLKKYRKSLGERTEAVIKVHSVLVDGSQGEVFKGASTSSSPAVGNRSFFKAAKNRQSYEKKTVATNDTSKAQCQSFVSPSSSPSIFGKSNNASDASQCSTSTANDSALNLSSASQNLDEDVEMEWSPVEAEEVVNNIQKLRQEKALMVTNNDYIKSNSSADNSNVDNLYVVVDTNVFISHLTAIKDLINYKPLAIKFPIIVVPWMVIQELDFFKDGRSSSDKMKLLAMKAVKFINKNLTSKNPRLKGQTVRDALKQEAPSSNPDDGILFCCLQLAQQSKATVLLSNDVNLRNKALIHDVSACGTGDVIAEIENVLFKDGTERKTKGERIASVFANLCNLIVDNEMKLAYGTVANNLLTKPPWSLKQCLSYFKRFWSTVFSLVIPQKQFLKIVEDLILFHATHGGIVDDDVVEEFTKLCLSMCVYFKNCLAKYKEEIQACIDALQEIVN